jgi:hypothetical protein
MNSALETNRAYINVSAQDSPGFYILKKHKPRFDEGCSKLLDQRKQALLQWLQNPGEMNENGLNSAELEANRHFRNEKK